MIFVENSWKSQTLAKVISSVAVKSNCSNINTMKLLLRKSSSPALVLRYFTGVAILIHYYTSLCHCPFMALTLTFAWFTFYLKHFAFVQQFFSLNYSYVFILLSFSLSLPSFYFFIFHPYFPPPFPIPPHPRPPSFLSFPTHQSPQPPLKTLSAAAPAPPPCW